MIIPPGLPLLLLSLCLASTAFALGVETKSVQRKNGYTRYHKTRSISLATPEKKARREILASMTECPQPEIIREGTREETVENPGFPWYDERYPDMKYWNYYIIYRCPEKK